MFRLLVLVILFVKFGSIESNLYTHEDPVNILYTSNVSQWIEEKSGHKIQLVQFFSSYCGHCIHFAPTFKTFLKEIESWRHLISISVLDCANTDNSAACSKYDVNAYPTLRAFWFKPEKGHIGEHFQHRSSGEELRHGLLKWITDNWKKGSIPPNWPHIPALNGPDRQSLIGKLRLDSHIPVVIVVEKDNSYLGRELLMEFSQYNHELQLFRMVESDIRLIEQLVPNVFEKIDTPFLLTVDQSEKFQLVPKPILTSDDHLKTFRQFLREHFVKSYKGENLPQHNGGGGGGQIHQMAYADRIHLNDLNNAVRYTLFHEIMLKKRLNLKETNALIHYLTVLSENFPFESEKSRQFIKHFHDWLTKKVNFSRKKNEKYFYIDMNDVRATMNMYEEHYHFPELSDYQACADLSADIHRSHPCSLWTLFHHLTVAEYQKSLQSRHWSSLHATLYAMRGYITNFFACTDCARHFASMSAELENVLTYSNSSVLWLWRAHNRVNSRLNGTKSDDPRLPKRQFPTQLECSTCFHKTEQYNEQRVLEFLVNFYSANRIVTKPQVNSLQSANLLSPIRPSYSGSTKIFSLFTHLDYSLIIVLYAVSLVMLASLFLYLCARKRRKSRKSYV